MHPRARGRCCRNEPQVVALAAHARRFWRAGVLLDAGKCIVSMAVHGHVLAVGLSTGMLALVDISAALAAGATLAPGVPAVAAAPASCAWLAPHSFGLAGLVIRSAPPVLTANDDVHNSTIMEIATGGDDGALVVTTVAWSDALTARELGRVAVPGAHASSVRGTLPRDRSGRGHVER